MSATAVETSLREQFLKQVQEKREELEPVMAEFNELRELEARLQGDGSGPKETRRSVGRPRGRKGGRLQSFVDDVKAHPGTTIPESAKRMGMDNPNYLYRIREKAIAEGRITTADDGKLFSKDESPQDSEPSAERIRQLEAAAQAS